MVRLHSLTNLQLSRGSVTLGVAFGLERYARHFVADVIYARTDLIQNNPDLVQRFLNGFFASIRFVKTHKDETSAIAVSELQSSPAIMARVWDELSPWLDDQGTFDPQGVEALKQSYVDLQMLEQKPRTIRLLSNASSTDSSPASAS
jgi:ABC-type nitrate/sulfonate/bicarbonate transport system substrate-binding protein